MTGREPLEQINMNDKVVYEINIPEILTKYLRIGFKLVPLENDSTPNVNSTNEIYNNPDYWTEEKLTQNYWRFSNIATTFGITHVQETKDDLYLHCLDIDSDNVLSILFDLLNELKSRSFVTKTKKDCGYHIYWLSRTPHPPIGTTRCKLGYEFEIKSDNSLGLCTLPPSVHRDDSSFKYKNIGSDYAIAIDDQLYDRLLGMLSDRCLKDVINAKDSQKDNTKAIESWSDAFRLLGEGAIEEIVSALKNVYQKGHRNSIVFGLSGLLFKSHVSLVSAQNIINKLCDCSNDEEKTSRLEVVKSTYLKGIDGTEIKGTSQLQETLAAVKEGDRDYVGGILRSICKIISGKDGYSGDDNKANPSTAETVIQLAKENTSLLKDQYNIAYAKIKLQDHNEIIALTSNKFEYFLRKLYYDYTHGKVASQDAINNAIGVLVAQALFDGPTQVLHLRVAWGQDKNEIYYDLTDPKWQCIRISEEGMSIIQDPPVLFIRFNQQYQLEPDRNYPQNIFDKFLDLMHITNRGHRLLTKVWIVSLLIPDFPHPISITFGEKGGSKSTFCRFIKRLVDPDRIELLTIPKDKAEFVQQLYHNYIAVYDNIKQLPPWFSDEACKAITGVGNSKRRFYTDDEDVIYKYKRCLMINGINNSLTEPDAQDRSILTEFNRIFPEQRREESKVEADFEEMRPKLLGYILDTVVKALQIKSTVELSSLPRMADFAVWGEAIARAMGYNTMEFINAYNENIGRLNIEVLEANVLAQVIIKFVESWYDEEKKISWEGSTKEALEHLNKIAQAYKIDINDKSWPKAPNYLTRRLRPILSNLREGLGINIVISRQTTLSNDDARKKNTSTIRIEKVSPLPPLPPPSQNQAQDCNQNGGGILTNEDTTSTQLPIPPPENEQNHTQNTESGDSGDSGGTIPTLEGRHSDNSNKNIFQKRYVAFDFEWSQEASSQLFAAAFVDSDRNTKALHISDYAGSANPGAELLKTINQQLLTYDFSVGWYSTGVARYHEDTQEYLDGVDSDLAILHNRCVANDVDSLVEFNSAGTPYISGQTHIDLYNVFSKPMVQNTIFKNAYRSVGLDEVSKAILADTSHKGRGSGVIGKYKGLTGEDIQSLPVEEQKKYVLRDADLVMQLSKHNVFDAMKSISEITGLGFDKVCRTGLSTWWAAIFDNMAAASSYNRTTEKLELQYVGGLVLQPKKGLYHNLIVADVTSLYPTMAILYNISFDTVNCECCKNDLQCRISEDITKDCRMQKEYWICRQKEGAFPNKLKIFKEERLEQKKLGNQDRQLALKILINGGYGVFGSQYFKYCDPRVAELITAYGRYTISKMKDISQNMGFDIVYGDTDSLFLNCANMNTAEEIEIISKFKEECNKQLGVEVEHAKTYQTAIISEKKKHYIGWTGIEEREPDIVGMEGDKNDRPKWINSVFRQIVSDILVSNDTIASLKSAAADLELGNVNPELLKRTTRLSKNPEEYENENDRKRKIGLAVDARKGDVVEYFETDNNKEGYSLNSQDISIKKYKIMLWKTVKDVLEIAGYDIATLERELFDNTISHMAMPSRGVAGCMTSYTSFVSGANQVANNYNEKGGEL